MAQKTRLRQNRYGTVINTVSSNQELQLGDALIDATERLTAKFGVVFRHEKKSDAFGDCSITQAKFSRGVF